MSSKQPVCLRLRKQKYEVKKMRYLFSAEYLRELLYMIPAVLIAITVHEFAHGYVSYKLGDPTPKLEGRLTLNPFAHLELWGTICLLLFRMGWAKPVRINTAYYKDQKKGIILVSLAGPGMNYLTAFLGMLIYGVCLRFGSGLAIWFLYLAVLNIGLGTFNLIPLPPLDGSNVLLELAPGVRRFYAKIRRFAVLILFLCLVSGILWRPLNIINMGILNGMWALAKRVVLLI